VENGILLPCSQRPIAGPLLAPDEPSSYPYTFLT
jgi:hypothetical protein